MNRFINIGAWSLFGIIVLTLLAFADADYKSIEVESAEINIDKTGGHDFVTQEGVLTKLNNMGYKMSGERFEDIDVDRIESTLSEFHGVKAVEVYKEGEGKVAIELKQRKPIARVLKFQGAETFYIDESGKTMAFKRNEYIAKVPLFTGEIDTYYENISLEDILKSDSLSSKYLIDDIYRIA